MGHGDGGIGTEGDLPLVGILVLRKSLLARINIIIIVIVVVIIVIIIRLILFDRSIISTSWFTFSDRLLESFIGFLQEGHVVIECFHVETAVDVQVTVAVHRITQRGAVVALRTPHPRISAVV